MAPKVLASNIALIGPWDCDSSVSYRIIKQSWGLESDVTLADCNRKVSWAFHRSGRDLAKIDAAIAMLREFRKHYVREVAKHPVTEDE